MSPARSAKQQRLMAAALHGADFPKAQQIRRTMSLSDLKEFAAKVTPKKGKKR